jgi:predicted ATPase/class 3 adenylate cyclase
MRYRGALPTGTVTFLFSDIEGSTRLVQRIGDRYTPILETQQRLLREAFGAHGGVELGTEGDSFFVVFPTAPQAVAAAVDAQRAVAEYAWPEDATVRIRMGLHTGEGTLGGDNYVGLDVNRAARIAGVAYGGQVLISESTRSLVELALEEGMMLLDLGAHRLKDLLQPERVFQIVHPELAREFPALATLSSRPNNLPTQTSEFLGREAELAALGKLLDGGARLVTLTGPGGMGKTRLSLQTAAARMDSFKDGLYFVDLAPIRDPDRAFEETVRAIGLQGASDQRPLDLLKQQLETKHMLLILDNLEQVMNAADGAAELLQSCPGLVVLVTSREALRVRGERVFPVPPMSLPPAGGQVSAEVAGQSEAVRLFVERAASARGSFDLTDENAGAISEICARLDGLPLAIELAAARLTLFSASDLRDRLRGSLQLVSGGARDLPARQQTLRSTIEWSYELLDTDERALFRVLSVFSSAPIVAVEEVALGVEPLRNVAVIDRLASLVDKSLVRSLNGTGPRRLSMLAAIQEYASERLEEDLALAAAARRSHAEYFSEFARARRGVPAEPLQGDALNQLEAEIGNLRTAWRFWVDAGELAKLEELFDALWALHETRGSYGSAVELAQDLLEVLSAAPSRPDAIERRITLATRLARGLLAVGGHTKEAEEAYEQVRALLEEAGALPQLYPVLRTLASFYQYRGEFDKGLVVGRQLLDLAEHSNDVRLKVDAHLVVGANLGSIGEGPESLVHLDNAIELFDPRTYGSAPLPLGPNPGVTAHTLSASVLWLRGETDRSVERMSRAVEIATRLNHPYTLAYALHHASFLDLWRRDYASVRERSGAAMRTAEEHGYEVWRAVSLVLQGTALIALGSLEQGLLQSDQGMVLYQQLSTPPVFWPFVLSIRARGFALAGRPAEGLELVDMALEMLGPRHNILSCEFPLLKGDLLLAISGPDEAEPWFQLAFDASRVVGARTTELRAATRLARLWRETGKANDGVELLRPIYESFAGNRETLDLVEAREVLGGP